MTADREPERLRRLENKIDRLFRLCLLQTAVISIVTAHYLFSLVPKLAFAMVLALPILYVLRRALPRWARRCGQFLGSLVLGRPSPSSKSG